MTLIFASSICFHFVRMTCSQIQRQTVVHVQNDMMTSQKNNSLMMRTESITNASTKTSSFKF